MTEQLSTYLNDELYEKDAMFYTYILRSVSNSAQRYVGHTADLRSRLAEHNSGKSPHTAKFRPWKVETYIAFESLDLNSPVEHLTQRCREAESAENISSFENTISYDSNPHEGSHHLKDDATTNSGHCDNASNSHFPSHPQPLCGSA